MYYIYETPSVCPSTRRVLISDPYVFEKTSLDKQVIIAEEAICH